MGTITTEPRSEPLVLVFGSDDNDAMSLAVALYSALVHLQRSCPLYLCIIDGGISHLSRRRLHRVVDANHSNVELQWLTPNISALSDLKIGGHITAATYYRLLIPDVIPERFNRAIYLDCDIQVEANLAKLCEENLDGHALLAVRDFLIPYVSSPGGLTNYQELGFRPETPYFNAGVLVMNLKRWRAEVLSEKVFRYLRQYKGALNFLSQEGLNAVLAGDWGMLDPKWNVASSILSYERWGESDFKEEIEAVRDDLLRNPYIHHFIGPNKPWQLNCEHPAKLQWRYYLEESRWFSPVEERRRMADSTQCSQHIRSASGVSNRKVTIGIPTCNRSQFLKVCLKSVLSQDYPDFQVVVLDNASADDTEAVVQSFGDSHLTYIRNEMNIGLFGNWNRVLEMNRSPYVTILPDDDVMLPGFISESVKALDMHQSAAFSAGLARYIDANGVPLHVQNAGDMPDGVIAGLEYLHRIVAGPVWVAHPATVLMRSSALAAVGPFGAPHSKQLLDLNLYIRLASKFDMVFIRRELARVRLHAGQGKERELHAIEGTQPLAMIAEHTDAVAQLLRSDRARDTSYREWLAERLLSLNRSRGDLTRLLVPSLNLNWREQQQIDAQKIAGVIPPGDTFILVDENIRMCELVAGRRAFPFLERDGVYWGNPLDDETAIQELERMRQNGASFMVFGWPAFWWFDYYSQFYKYLRSRFPCVLESERLVVLDLRPEINDSLRI